MATYTATAKTSWSREQTFDYLADFRTVSDWDPGILRSVCKSGTPPSEDSRYDVDVETLGRTTTFEYETIELQRPERVVLRAETGSLISVDTMTFVDTGSGTEVTYNAEITLKGLLKLADPLFSLAFQRVGDKAKSGLRERLAGPAPVAAGRA